MRKTDAQLQSDVQEELEWEPSLHAAEIGVAAHDGVVTLTGHALSYAQKLAAERAAKRVLGVAALANDVAVRMPFSYERDDTDIAEAISRALTWSTAVPDDAVQATVSNGWVELEGVVEWNYQRDAAYRAVRELAGVKGVVNKITLKPTVSPSEIKTRIESAFERTAQIDAHGITVEASGGEVTLRGTVRSWAEYEAAEDTAWAGRGVTSVVNLLAVEAEVGAFI